MVETRHPKLSLLKNLLIQDTLPGRQLFWSLYIWVVYLFFKNIILISFILTKWAKGTKPLAGLLIVHVGSLILFVLIAIFLTKLQILWNRIRELIGFLIMASQVYFFIEQDFNREKSIDIIVHGYIELSLAFALIFFDSISNLSKALACHVVMFVYIMLSAALRCEAIRYDDYNAIVFTLITGLGTSLVLAKLRYAYQYQKLSFEKTIRSWKKVMNLCEIGISIENKNFVKYRNNKYQQYLEQIITENPTQLNASQNHIVINDTIYFAGTTSKLCIIKDITEIKRVEQSKFNNLLIATITHELRTPLNIIMAILELFIDGSSPPSIKVDASKALCAASMQETLINDILNMAKITNGNLIINSQPTEIHSILQSIFELFKFKVDKSIDFNLCIHSSIPRRISLDERRYKQIVFNILSNACKFTLLGFIKIKTTYKGSKLITSVKDSGIGIETKNFPKIFTQFGMLENNAQLNKSGTGLGLNLCRILSHKMGGDISFKSQYKVGSKFKFSIDAPVVESSIITVIKPILSEKKLIIVDDNNMNIEVLKSFASKVNIPHLAYNNSEKALLDLQKENDFIGFFDLNMPNISGYDLAHSIKAACKKCKLIAVTGEDSQMVIQKCKQCGFDEVIEKPVSYKKFCQCLE